MIKTIPMGVGIGNRVARKHPVKLTALLYLKDALKGERYEECAGIIAIAKEFGATEAQVRYLLEDVRRNPT